ncbi:MAG: IS1380 family transposase, partial [Pseudomonadota bacterium]
HIKTDSFLANSALFQCAIFAYNTLRWMAMISGDTTLRSWEVQTIRAFLIRVAGKLLVGGDQLKLKTPPDHLYAKQWNVWTALAI